MRFPIYPEKLRKLAQFMLRIRYILLALMFIGIAALAIGIESVPQNFPLILAGIVLSALGAMFFTTFHASNAMIQVEILNDGIHILDQKGEVFRSTEYRYVRNIEVRTLQLTEVSSEDSKNHYPPSSGIETQLIMLYLNSAWCFDDLQLQQLGRSGKELYWCDKVFYHSDCIAFVYNEEAWQLLNKQMSAHSTGNI